jgi:hypothetical protein
MSHKAAKIRSAELFASLQQPPTPICSAEDEPLDLAALDNKPIQSVQDSSKTLRMKKFRAQLLHHWLVNTFSPCRAVDIGGGKGLLAYLLRRSGWDAVVIDPFDQVLPDKYKDIDSRQRVKVPSNARVPHITAAFSTEMAEGFDLLIGMHAHGCNAKIIDAAERYSCGFVIFPCCVIDEPFFPRLGVLWIESLANYAGLRGQPITPFRLNFKGQNIGLCHVGKARLRVSSPG